MKNYYSEMNRNLTSTEVNASLTFVQNVIAKLSKHSGKKNSSQLQPDIDGLCAEMPILHMPEDMRQKCSKYFSDMYLSGKVSKGAMQFFQLAEARLKQEERKLEEAGA